MTYSNSPNAQRHHGKRTAMRAQQRMEHTSQRPQSSVALVTPATTSASMGTAFLVATIALLVLLISPIHGFKHKNYCGEICRVGQCAKIRVHVHDPEKVHITVTGVAEVDKDFRIYKKEGTRAWMRICSETGFLCNEEYEFHDEEDRIRLFIQMPWYKGGDVSENLLPC